MGSDVPFSSGNYAEFNDLVWCALVGLSRRGGGREGRGDERPASRAILEFV